MIENKRKYSVKGDRSYQIIHLKGNNISSFGNEGLLFFNLHDLITLAIKHFKLSMSEGFVTFLFACLVPFASNVWPMWGMEILREELDCNVLQNLVRKEIEEI